MREAVPVVRGARGEALSAKAAQPKPVPLVQFNAFPDAEHEGTAKPVGVVAVNAPSTVLAEMDAKPIVPVVVIVPPVIPLLVAMLVTVPVVVLTAVPLMYNPPALIVPAPFDPPVTVLGTVIPPSAPN